MIKVNERGFVYDDSPNPLWLPPVNLKQFEVFNDFHRYPLIDGPRKSSKTYGIIHKVIRHAFDVGGAMFGIVNKTLKNAKSSGVWTLLSNWMLPFWQHGYGDKWEPWMPEAWKYGCPGFKVVEGPKTTGDTKLSFVRIRNRHGTVSEIQCHSLEHATEVEAKFKGPFYSGFWLSELDQYCTRHAFDIFCDALRMPGVPYQEHQILSDLNPPESGENNWMHDMWFKEREKPPVNDEGFDPIFHANLHRIGFTLDDNPQLDPTERREMVARYKKRKGLYDRFVLGKWTQDVVDGHFSHVWDETVHVLGNADGSKEDWEIIVPTDACDTLLCGWDIGDRNHSFHILEKIIRSVPGTNRRMISFSILDEVVAIMTSASTAMFAEACLDRILYWEKWMKEHHKRDIQWRHWSDSSAFVFSATAGSMDAAVVYEATNGKVSLNAAPKYRNSNHDKVNVLCELMHSGRLHVSAQLRRTRAMFANLKSGGDAEFIKENEHKHPFDSVSYPILAEAPQDMFKSGEVRTEKQREPSLIVAGV